MLKLNKTKLKFILNREEILNFAINQVKITGQWLEFGVGGGWSINYLSNKTQNKIYGFDWFKGLPEDWDTLSKGSFCQNNPPEVKKNVEIINGLFQETLPNFNKETISFIHLDADLYSSTIFVLNQLNDFIIPNTIMVFDEFFNHPEHEEKALKEWLKTHQREVKHLARGPEQLILEVIV